MPTEKPLIFIKNQDKSDQINQIQFNHETGKWEVMFKNSRKVYEYNPENVVEYQVKETIHPDTKLVYVNGQPISGVETIVNYGKYVKLLYKNGYKEVYSEKSIILEETALTNSNASNVFNYLKELAERVSIRDESDKSFLKKQYEKIKVISPRSVLAAYLGCSSTNASNDIDFQPIFPFGFNLSQRQAAEKALASQISVIQGPPGTGKTQTILNIIASAILQNKTVAVVSNNNSATENVLDKLKAHHLDFFAAFLGNAENQKKFISEQTGQYPDMKTWNIPQKELDENDGKLSKQYHQLKEMLKVQNKRAKKKREREALRTEKAYFEKYFSTFEGTKDLRVSRKPLTAEKLLTFLVTYKQAAHKGNFSWIHKLHTAVRYGLSALKVYRYTPEEVVTNLQKTYYEMKMKELDEEINSLSKTLKDYDFDQAMDKYSELSMQLLRSRLSEKYGTKKKRPVFNGKITRHSTFKDFIKEYPVILSTTHSLLNCIPRNYLFDYVIIDEASQVDIVTGALALSAAKKAVIVGDNKQLPHVVPDPVEKETSQIFSSYKLHKGYHYAEHSLLTSVQQLFPDIPETLLREHYRCHPKIIEYCNQKFYNNELIPLTEEYDDESPLVVFKTVKGNHARGKVNQRQIDVILKEILPKYRNGSYSVGVISPFRLQKEELKKQTEPLDLDIEVDTVHKFQGRERDMIILTTVANRISARDFVDQANLINVAVSRAVHKLMVVVSDEAEKWEGTNIGDLIRYIRYHNYEIVESKIYSVFDLLYKCYSEKLLKVLESAPKVSRHSSENLLNIVVQKVLSQPEFQHLDYVLHQPLRMLIKDTNQLTQEERQYAMNVLTHTDFLIYKKMDKTPVLVVEVDGYAFHENNPVQKKRDQMKDRILKKYGIPIIRMKTTESEEEKRLKEKLEEVLR